MTMNRPRALLLMSTALAVMPGTVRAQVAGTGPNSAPATATPVPSETGAASSQGDVSEIIVTANKRRERIQDVALSIGAVTSDELQRQQVRDIDDLAQRVAGLSFTRGGNVGSGLRIVIRGLNTGGNGATAASELDDAPLSFSSPISNGSFHAVDLEPWDLSQVEVLRGPQGTLYGANAEGGLIKYVSALPDLHELHGGFDVGLYNLTHGGLGESGKGYLSVPIVDDKVGIRTSGFYEHSPSWIGNQLGGQKNTNAFDRYGGRVVLLLKPTESLTIRGTAFYQKLDSDGFDAVEVNGIFTPYNQFQTLHGYNLNTFLRQPNSVESQLYIANVTYDLGGALAQSITSYGTINNHITNDVPIYGQAFGGLLFGRPNTTLFYDQQSNLRKFNQEFRVASENGSAKTGHGLEWQLGLFYTYERVRIPGNYFTRDQTTGLDVTTPLSPASAEVIDSDLPQHYREIAGYADATYHFSPNFDIEAGTRVFNNSQRAQGIVGGALAGAPPFSDQGVRTSKETSATFAVAPRYHFNADAMIYARVASGYRPGGPENPVPNAPAGLPTSFSSDRTVNYEAGLKGTFLHNMLSVDVAGFYIDWSDVQINVTLPLNGIGYTIVQNAGKAISQGGEFNLNLRPMRGLDLSAVGAYTDAKLARSAPSIGGTRDDQLPYVPRLAFTLTGNYDWSLGGAYEAFIGGSYTHTSERFSTYILFPSINHLPIPGYDTFAAQLGVRRGKFGLMLYGKNLSDKAGITSYYGGIPVFGLTIPGQVGLIRPREIGLRLTGSF